MVEQHVIGDDRADARRRGEVGEVVKAQSVARTTPKVESQVRASGEDRVQPAQAMGADLVGLVGDEDGDQTLGEVRQVRPVEITLSLAGAPFAERQQPTKAGVSGSISQTAAWLNSSSQEEAPRRKEKCEVACSSA
jgi:hypothetical protein